MSASWFLFTWVKRLGQRHYSIPSSGQTLCGMPMLGNNYAKLIPEGDQEECTECARGAVSIAFEDDVIEDPMGNGDEPKVWP